MESLLVCCYRGRSTLRFDVFLESLIMRNLLSRLVFFLLCSVLVVGGCAGSEVEPPVDGTQDMGGMDQDRPDAFDPTEEMGGDCVPMTCAETQQACGTLDDGCDSTIECGPCATSIEIDPTRVQLFVGEKTAVTATVTGEGGSALPGAAVRWTSQNEEVATVDEAGSITAVAKGGTTVTAKSGEVRRVVDVTVLERLPTTLVIDPSPVTVNQKSIVLLTAQVLDQSGTALDTPGEVTWMVGDTNVATISPAGELRGEARGMTIVQAQKGELSAEAQVTVTYPDVAFVQVMPASMVLAPGTSGQIAAIPYDVDGDEIDDLTVTFTSRDASIATVDGTGRVTGQGVGQTIIEVEANAEVNTVNVEVLDTLVGDLGISPASLPNMAVGETFQLNANPTDLAGDPIVCTLTWSSIDPSVATVSANGLVSAVGVGTGAITVECEGVMASLSLVVSAKNLAITPATGATLLVGQTVQFSAEATDFFDRPMACAITWTSSAPAVATINASGLVTALSQGTTTITGSCAGLSVSLTVTVATVATVEISPSPSADVALGGMFPLQARALDANGNELTCPSMTWASTNPTVATVDANGRVAGLSLGQTNVTAECLGRTGVVTVSVVGTPTLPGALQDPSRLKAWFVTDTSVTSSGGQVSTWTDISGNTFTMASSGTLQPTLVPAGLNGKPIIRFSGGQGLRTTTTHLSLKATTIFVVAKNTSASHRGQILSNCTSGGNNQFRYNGSATSLFLYGQSAWSATLSLSAPTTTFQTIAMTYDPSTATVTIHQNGVQTGMTTATGSTMGDYNIGQIGGRCSSERLNGEIAEILIFNETLSAAERQQVEAYLSVRFGL